MNTLLTILNSKFIQSSLALRCLSTACEHQGVDVAVAEYTINQNVYDILRHIASFGLMPSAFPATSGIST